MNGEAGARSTFVSPRRIGRKYADNDFRRTQTVAVYIYGGVGGETEENG